MIELKHELNINLGLILTHQLELSLKVLASSLIELQEQVDGIILENPLIAIDKDFKEAKPNYFENKFKEVDQAYKVKFESEDEYDEFDFIEEEKPFTQELFEDLILSYDLNNKEAEVAKIIIYNIDENGFLSDYILDIKLEHIRQKIIQLEPFGCASYNTKEFFHLQNSKLFKNEPFFIELVRFIDSIFDVGLDIKKLQRFGFDLERANFLLEKIKTFKPYPLHGYSKVQNQDFIYYDIEIKQIGNNFLAIVNDKFLNKLTIDESLIKHCNETYLKDKLKEIKIISEAIYMRSKTLLKIANIVIDRQRAFFEGNILKPLSMSEISRQLGYSVSTISRAIANKYILFKSKVYPFKMFFSNESKEGVSKHRILEIIRTAISKESVKDPLDDESIRQILFKNNIHVTRRAIVKYRKELKIPKARDRRLTFENG